MNKTRIVLLGSVAIIAVAFFIWLTNSYVLKSQAAEKKADILITQGDAINGMVPITFIIQPKDTQDLISGVDLFLSTKDGAVEKWDGCSSLDGKSDLFTELINTKGKDGRYSCVVLKSSKDLPKTVVIKGAVNCSAFGTTTVSVMKEKTDVVGPVEGTKYALDTVAIAQVNCLGGTTEKPKVTEDMLTSFAPSDCRTSVGGTCDYKLEVKSRNTTDHISGIYMKLKFDPSILQFGRLAKVGEDVQGLMAQATTPTVAPTTAPISCKTDADCPSPCANPTTCATNIHLCRIPTGSTTGTCLSPNVTVTTAPTPTGGSNTTPSPTSGTVIPTAPQTTGIPTIAPQAGCDVRQVENDSVNGTVSFLYVCNKPATQLPTVASLPFTFKAIGNGSGELSIDSVQITGPEITGQYSVAKSKATYTVGERGSGNVKLNMKLRMQCVVARPKGANTIKVKIGIGDGGLKAPLYETADFKVDDNGFWNGSVAFNLRPGSGYKIMPKGEKHMQKKVCVNNPKEDYPGAYSCDKGAITLKDGENTIDLSQIVLLSGDLPPGEQDGISNAKDQSLVRNLLGKRDEESARLADINYDGVVNAVDHSCLIAALAVRWDEQ